VPPKVRELIAELQNGGFTDRGGKGSHRNFVHPKVAKPVTYRVLLATMPSITRFELYAER
jgi:predicted RNA binding protein YcfA (HicA-like mRNA interferase family)